MKKTAFIFILALFINLYSQPFGKAAPQYRIVELDYENSSGEQGTTLFRYDDENRLCKALWSLDDKSRYSFNYYEHDAQGNLISTFREFSDSLSSSEIFNYDAAGNKTSEHFYRSDSISGSATWKYEGNRLVQVELKKYKGWLSGSLQFYYKADQIEKATLTKDGKAICGIAYDYDTHGNLVREFWDFGNWSQTFVYSYEKLNQNRHFYSSPFLTVTGNHRISKEDYTFNDEIGGQSAYYYDKNGLLAKKIFTRDDGLMTKTFYEYDQGNKLVSSKRIYSDSSTATFSYVYDENDNLVRRNFYRADTLFGFESYLYNAEGELVKAYLKNFDNWLSGTINFHSDFMGNLVSGDFKSESGFTADIHFQYNKEMLLSEIDWKFSFGKFQHYHFEY